MFLKYIDVKVGEAVIDTWFPYWGCGIIRKKLKTRIHIDFSSKGMVVFDIPHLQFLEKL